MIIVDYLFKDFCVVNGIRKLRYCLPTEWGADLLTARYNKENFSLETKLGQVCLQPIIKDSVR